MIPLRRGPPPTRKGIQKISLSPFRARGVGEKEEGKKGECTEEKRKSRRKEGDLDEEEGARKHGKGDRGAGGGAKRRKTSREQAKGWKGAGDSRAPALLWTCLIQFVSPGVPRDAFLWLAGSRARETKRVRPAEDWEIDRKKPKGHLKGKFERQRLPRQTKSREEKKIVREKAVWKFLHYLLLKVNTTIPPTPTTSTG